VIALPQVGLALVLLGAPGCAAVLTTLGGAPPEIDSPTPRVGDLRDVRVVVHCHSHRSHDSDGTDDEIAAAARATGTEVVLLTDHPRDAETEPPPAAWVDGVLFVPGQELSKLRGAILGLGARGATAERHGEPRELVQALRARGVIVALGHGELYGGDDAGLADIDAVEVYNLHADAVDESIPGIVLRALFLPPGAFFRSIMDDPLAEVLGRLDRLSRQRPRAVVAGNDSHANIRLFGPAGGTIGTYEETFRAVATHLLVPPGPLTEQMVLEAIRAGRTYVAFELDASAAGFSFVARLDGHDHLPGAVIAPGAELMAQAAHPAAHLTVVRDGRPFASGRGLVRARASEPGVYRVEVSLEGRPWVLSSPIVVDGVRLPSER
jgi:hypothetical protein